MPKSLKLFVKKLHKDAKLPTKAYSGDAAFDLYAYGTPVLSIEPTPIKTGISVKIPDGYCGIIKPKSGLAVVHGVNILAGVIDSGYTGEVIVLVTSLSEILIHDGQKVAQMLILPVPEVEVEEVDELPLSERGEKGFGSSGK